MASWSTRRKYGYFTALVIVLVLFIGVPLFFLFYKEPTCSDGKMNGSERGIDCGGKCARLCPADFSANKILWSYSMKIVPGVYNALAYIQNPNQGAEIKSLPYLFKLYDAEGVLITQKAGSVYVPAGQKFVAFEGGLRTGERIPVKTTFEFTDVPAWRVGKAFTALHTLNVDLSQGTSPKADIKVKNDAVDRSFANIDTYVVLYDKDDNRVSFSKTVIEQIGPGESQTLYFTWPEAFERNIVRTEVIFMARPQI